MNSNQADVLLLEPFFGGSHQQWAEGYQSHSKLKVEILSLSAHHWKWRMHGGAPSLARRYLANKQRPTPNLILASAMLDVAVFMGLTRGALSNAPLAVYFHENQLTYPWSGTDQDPALGRDLHYAFINFTSALAADAVLFNSAFHQAAFLDALPALLKRFPDHNEFDTVAEIRAKSSVLHLGLELNALGQPLETDKQRGMAKATKNAPTILWNHRWEQDKGPQAFGSLLDFLRDKGVDFKLILLGKDFPKQEGVSMREIAERFEDRIVHKGFVEDRDTYFKLLAQADFCPVTSRQDFFGISAVEAMYTGAYPLLPRELAFSEHLPKPMHDKFLYSGEEQLKEKSLKLFSEGTLKNYQPEQLQAHLRQYDWSRQAGIYDAFFLKMMASKI